MAEPERTQKQIAARYQRNLTLYERLRRGRLGRFILILLAVCAALAGAIVYQKRGDEKFFNPGKLSASHAGLSEGCGSCHDKSLLRPAALTPAKFQQVLNDRFRHGVPFDPIDQKCAACHLKQDKRIYDFHQPNVVKNRSCSVCHQEHRGIVRLRLVASTQCAACHNDAQTMEAAAQKGMQLHWDTSRRHPHPAQQIVFDLPRPTRGYTQTFAAFWNGHPEFQLKREPVRDPDVLKFNHQRHFASDIPSVNGKKLECSFCHQPDPQGRYNQRITFKAHCQVCHSLQFDPKNPELMLPHGDTVAVRGFLRALPTQYADLAVKKGMTRPNDIRNFVTKQMLQLRERMRWGEDFEQQVFFVADPYKPQRETEPRVRASFYGCALCHQVQPVANAAPYIAKPVFMDRWMPQADFDHAQHKMVKCDDCHHATQSRLTSDVLMPGINDCNTCHSPKGKLIAANQKIFAAAECMTCHTYHAAPAVAVAQMR